VLRDIALISVAAVTACKSDARHPPSVAATASVADAATRAVDGPLPDPKAVDAAAVDAATVDAPSGPVTLGLCPAITAVLAAQDSWFQTLRGTGTGERGLPLATVQLEGASAALFLRPDDRAGDWTARRSAGPDVVEAWIREAAACPPIADWYQVAASATNHSWKVDDERGRDPEGVRTVRSIEVWISGGKREAWVTISVIDQELEPGD
jgi:hypothetical protein